MTALVRHPSRPTGPAALDGALADQGHGVLLAHHGVAAPSILSRSAFRAADCSNRRSLARHAQDLEALTFQRIVLAPELTKVV